MEIQAPVLVAVILKRIEYLYLWMENISGGSETAK